jgi:hypothetical protein
MMLSGKRIVVSLASMSTVNVTMDIGNESAGVIAGLLSRFPKGQRVRIAVTDELPADVGSKPDLVAW